MNNTVIILPGDKHRIIKCDCPCHWDGCEHCCINKLIDSAEPELVSDDV